MTPDKIAALSAKASASAPQGAIVRPKVPGLVIHIDGDMICYFCAGDKETPSGEARRRALGRIEKFKRAAGAERAVVHLTNPAGNKGERALIATVKPYQGQRTGEKPKNHGYLHEFLRDYNGPEFTSKLWANREADDGVCACAYHAARSGKGPGYIAIATQDKDFRMFPGLHVDWISFEAVKIEDGCFAQTNNGGKLFGYKWFWMQMLMGDTADHIPGLPEYPTTNAKGEPCLKKMGEKTAEKFLEKATTNQQCFDEVYGLYLEYYAEHLGLGYEEADDRFVEQMSLLWMRSGIKADVDDVFSHMGMEVVWPDALKGAARVRLLHRVREQRRAIEALSS